MILSQKTSTLVLQTGHEINEIENTGFSTAQPTIFVGNLGNNRFIIQVTTKSIRLLQSTRLIQNVPIEVGSPVVQVSLCDPYVCIKVLNGQVITLALRETRGTPRLAINKNTISSVRKASDMKNVRSHNILPFPRAPEWFQFVRIKIFLGFSPPSGKMFVT